MKLNINHLLCVLTLMSMVWSCGSSSSEEVGIPVKGNILNPEVNKPVILFVFGENGLESLDTVAVDEGGGFALKLPLEGAPAYFRLNIQDRRQIDLPMSGKESGVDINVDLADLQSVPEITGAPETAYLTAFDQLVNNMKEDQNMLNQQAMQARASGEQSEMAALQDEYTMLVDDFYEKIKKYAYQIKPSLAVFYGLGSLKLEDHMTFYDSLADYYAQALPDHPFTKDLLVRVKALSATSIGSEAPEIALPNPDGDIITLSSLRGNYVLIDFWAAWCRPCRMENPNVLRAYNQYKNQNFEILGVSLDKNRESWLKAIDTDGLIWKHVSDLKYFQSEAAAAYNIQAIPATYLIDPDGKIIGKNLRGASLEAKLAEIFG